MKKKIVKIVANPFGYALEAIINEGIEMFSNDSKNNTPYELKEKALKAEIKASVLQSQAKVEQELSIARRIDSAEEVEIEEYFDTESSKNLGLDVTADKASLSFNADNHRVTKRVIKFKGHRYIQDSE